MANIAGTREVDAELYLNGCIVLISRILYHGLYRTREILGFKQLSSSDLESQVRRALGASSPTSAHKRRFGTRTDVEVVVRPGSSQNPRYEDRVELHDALKARDKSEQALAAAHATIRNLQTKVAHLEMCADELREQKGHASARIVILEAELAHQVATTKQATARLEAALTARKAAQRNPKAPRHADTLSNAVAPKRPSPEPVKSSFLPKAPSEKTSAQRGKPLYRTKQKPVDWWSHHERKAGRR